MNFHQYCMNELQANGMNENHALAIMEVVVNDKKLFGSMSGRWGDSIDGYPTLMARLTYMSVKIVAFKWIMENCPLAWYAGTLLPGADTLKDGEAQKFVDKFFTVRAEKLALKKANPTVDLADEIIKAMNTSDKSTAKVN